MNVEQALELGKRMLLSCAVAGCSRPERELAGCAQRLFGGAALRCVAAGCPSPPSLPTCCCEPSNKRLVLTRTTCYPLVELSAVPTIPEIPGKFRTPQHTVDSANLAAAPAESGLAGQVVHPTWANCLANFRYDSIVRWPHRTSARAGATTVRRRPALPEGPAELGVPQRDRPPSPLQCDGNRTARSC